MPTPEINGTHRAIAIGELDRLTDDERVAYYHAVCESVGLNPLTRPLEYLVLNGRLTLYAKRDATDQLRHKYQVSVEIIDRTIQEDVYVVRARASMPDGRTDESLGAVHIGDLQGDDLANALMKAETKAKRRVALSICGLGLLDETEVETIPSARGGAGETSAPRRLSPSVVFRAWDAQGDAPPRRELYDYANAIFGKRVTALSPSELAQVLQWLETRGTTPAPSEEAVDVLS
jgi:hypothetical protein